MQVLAFILHDNCGPTTCKLKTRANRQKKLSSTLSLNVKMAIRNLKDIGKKALISNFVLTHVGLLKKQAGRFPVWALFYWKEDTFLKRIIPTKHFRV